MATVELVGHDGRGGGPSPYRYDKRKVRLIIANMIKCMNIVLGWLRTSYSIDFFTHLTLGVEVNHTSWLEMIA